jgi:hypothetical protein
MTDHGDVEPGPIFITGLDRSGKTRLRVLLNALPDIHVARRTQLFSTLDGAYGDLSGVPALDALLGAIARRPNLADAVPKRTEVEADILAAPDPYVLVFARVLARYARAHGASRWGEQDTELMWHTERLSSALPSARVIHVVRDPRARHVLVRRDRPRTIGLVGATTAAWITSARIALSDHAADPEHRRIVRSEDLADAADPSLYALRAVDAREPASFPERFADDPGALTNDARFVERHAGPEMQALGYLPVSRSISGWRAARFRIAVVPARVRFRARRMADQRRADGQGKWP